MILEKLISRNHLNNSSEIQNRIEPFQLLVHRIRIPAKASKQAHTKRHRASSIREKQGKRVKSGQELQLLYQRFVTELRSFENDGERKDSHAQRERERLARPRRRSVRDREIRWFTPLPSSSSSSALLHLHDHRGRRACEGVGGRGLVRLTPGAGIDPRCCSETGAHRFFWQAHARFGRQQSLGLAEHSSNCVGWVGGSFEPPLSRVPSDKVELDFGGCCCCCDRLVFFFADDDSGLVQSWKKF